VARILWGGPVARNLRSLWAIRVVEYCRATKKHTVSLPLWNAHAGRIDIARSIIIETARQNPKFDWLLSFDTDVVIHPSVPFDTLVEILESDLAEGFGAVGAFTLDVNRNPQIGAPLESWAQASRFAPMPDIWHFAGGFFALHRTALDALRPLLEIELPGPDGPTKNPLYCVMSERETEDSSLCANLRNCGIRLAAEPRILAGHLKESEFYLDVNEIDRWAKNAQWALEHRVDRATELILANGDKENA
jgi:hypothetical protein